MVNKNVNGFVLSQLLILLHPFENDFTRLKKKKKGSISDCERKEKTLAQVTNMKNRPSPCPAIRCVRDIFPAYIFNPPKHLLVTTNLAIKNHKPKIEEKY